MTDALRFLAVLEGLDGLGELGASLSSPWLRRFMAALFFAILKHRYYERKLLGEDKVLLSDDLRSQYLGVDAREMRLHKSNDSIYC